MALVRRRHLLVPLFGWWYCVSCISTSVFVLSIPIIHRAIIIIRIFVFVFHHAMLTAIKKSKLHTHSLYWWSTFPSDAYFISYVRQNMTQVWVLVVSAKVYINSLGSTLFRTANKSYLKGKFRNTVLFQFDKRGIAQEVFFNSSSRSTTLTTKSSSVAFTKVYQR